MGFFSGLFEKKYCGICGKEVGVFGKISISDGHVCKDCSANLSPFFTGRKQSSLEEIRQQLEYRENNREAVAAFHTTRTLGVNTKVLLDEDKKQFMVTSASNLEKANPDVLSYSQITGCRLDVQESRHEMEYRLPDGERVAYNPPQYSVEYDFYMVLNVNHPYFDEIRFQLNNCDVTIEPNIRVAPVTAPRPTPAPTPVKSGVAAVKSASAISRNEQPQSGAAAVKAAAPTNKTAAPAKTGTAAVKAAAAAKAAAPAKGAVSATHTKAPVKSAPKPAAAPKPAPAPARPAPAPEKPKPQPVRVLSSVMPDINTDVDYVRFKQMGEDIVSALMDVHQEAREAAAPVTAVNCPYCGATTIPDASGCCEYCGSSLV